MHPAKTSDAKNGPSSLSIRASWQGSRAGWATSQMAPNVRLENMNGPASAPREF